jgi:hypothetical protein
MYGNSQGAVTGFATFFISLSFIPCLGFLKLEKNLEIFN